MQRFVRKPYLTFCALEMALPDSTCRYLLLVQLKIESCDFCIQQDSEIEYLEYCHCCGSRRGHAVAQLIEALRYKSEGRGLDSRWCHWYFSFT